jgi:hypothetical protein
MFDPQILRFPYDRNESSLLRSFKRWVPPSPNPLPMIDEEKDEASTHRVHNPPACKCGYCAELVNPPAKLDYTPFFHVLVVSSSSPMCCSVSTFSANVSAMSNTLSLLLARLLHRHRVSYGLLCPHTRLVYIDLTDSQ